MLTSNQYFTVERVEGRYGEIEKVYIMLKDEEYPMKQICEVLQENGVIYGNGIFAVADAKQLFPSVSPDWICMGKSDDNALSFYINDCMDKTWLNDMASVAKKAKRAFL